MTFAVFGNSYQEEHLDVIRKFFAALLAAAPGIRLIVDRQFRQWLDDHGYAFPCPTDDITDATLDGADMALSFGGDGTFLRTARRIAPRAIPVIGINTGHLGYLAAVSPANPGQVVRRILDGDYRVESRSMISVAIADRSGAMRQLGEALNEVAVLKQDTSSMVSVDARLNGELLAGYRADGLIVSTPTGSTGYNLSVGGPIVMPATGVWVVSPIAAHTLTMRPLVVGDTSEIELHVESRTRSFMVSVDGVSQPLPSGTTLRIRKSPVVTRIVLSRYHSYADTLREKLLWGV